jgi:hypothetical protein
MIFDGARNVRGAKGDYASSTVLECLARGYSLVVLHFWRGGLAC